MPTFRQRLQQDQAARASKSPNDAEIGGFWGQPHLSQSYALAARALRDNAGPKLNESDLVAPIIFCARHAVELALKDLLVAFHDNECAQAELDANDGSPPTTCPLDAATLRELPRTHDLVKLLGWVEQWMAAYVKPNWKALVTELDGYEGNAVERFRYSTVGKPDARRGIRSERSFERVLIVPVDPFLRRFEAFMREAASITSSAELEAIDYSALEELAMIGHDLDQKLYARGLL